MMSSPADARRFSVLVGAPFGLAVLTADGRAAEEEDSIFTTHLNHLRGELDTQGVAEDTPTGDEPPAPELTVSGGE